ncbi:MAG: serine dehydratase subunit alpha family protein, partial [Bacteroides sp.]
MIESERNQIIALVQREVIPAIGCTEPIAVALAVAKASETLGRLPQKITVCLSANILKNAMGVGIPGTGMIGLPIAVALGALIGKSEYQLEVLKESTPEAVEQGRKMIAERKITISLKEDITEKLYIEVICEAESEKATAIISGEHTNFVYIAKGEYVLLNKNQSTKEVDEEEDLKLNLRKVHEFATTAPLAEIRFILKAAELNKAAADKSFKGDYGHSLGKT